MLIEKAILALSFRHLTTKPEFFIPTYTGTYLQKKNPLLDFDNSAKRTWIGTYKKFKFRTRENKKIKWITYSEDRINLEQKN